jgi:hypothetical protein
MAKLKTPFLQPTTEDDAFGMPGMPVPVDPVVDRSQPAAGNRRPSDTYDPIWSGYTSFRGDYEGEPNMPPDQAGPTAGGPGQINLPPGMNLPGMPVSDTPPQGVDIPGGWGSSPDVFTDPSQIPGVGGGQQPPAFSQSAFLQAAGNYPPTPAGLRQLVADHPEWGLTIVGGSGGDIQLPDGTTIDVLISAGTGGGVGWQWLTGGAAPSGGGNASFSSFQQPANWGNLLSTLEGLYPGGLFNQNIVNQRTESARQNLERTNRSRNQTNRAALAARGLIGSGPEITALNRAEEDFADQYGESVQDIYSDESANADARMIQALQISAGMNVAEARAFIDWFRAQSDHTLGLGGLAIDNMNGQNVYNLGLGRLGLDRDRLLSDMEDADLGRLIEIMNILLGGANTASRGHV